MKDYRWTKRQLKAAWRKGEVAGIACNNLRVVFLMKNGVDRGVLVTSSDGVKLFRSDSLGWEFIEKLKREAESSL